MGPHSTAPFIDLVVAECQRQYGARDDIDFPKMVICSQPAPFYEDRPVDHQALEAAIRDGLATLERAGASFLAIACNTAHLYFPALAESVRVPLLNIVELAMPLLPDAVNAVALVAARPTAEAGLYQAALLRTGRRVVDVDWQDEVDAMLAATRDTTEGELFRARWSSLLDQAREAGADAVLVACLDLSGVIRHAPDGIPLVDSARGLAGAVVERWMALRSA